VTGYAADVAALARKDLRLELRARDTLPAMLLFVLATLVIFHFALPPDAGDAAAYGLLWVALVFTALLGLGRAWAKLGDVHKARGYFADAAKIWSTADADFAPAKEARDWLAAHPSVAAEHATR